MHLPLPEVSFLPPSFTQLSLFSSFSILQSLCHYLRYFVHQSMSESTHSSAARWIPCPYCFWLSVVFHPLHIPMIIVCIVQYAIQNVLFPIHFPLIYIFLYLENSCELLTVLFVNFDSVSRFQLRTKFY